MKRIKKHIGNWYGAYLISGSGVAFSAMILGCTLGSGDDNSGSKKLEIKTESGSIRNIEVIEIEGCEYYFMNYKSALAKADCDCKPKRK